MWLVDGPLFPNGFRSKYPAILFAGRHTASVPGRIEFVIVSIITLFGINPLNTELNPICQ